MIAEEHLFKERRIFQGKTLFNKVEEVVNRYKAAIKLIGPNEPIPDEMYFLGRHVAAKLGIKISSHNIAETIKAGKEVEASILHLQFQHTQDPNLYMEIEFGLDVRARGSSGELLYNTPEELEFPIAAVFVWSPKGRDVTSPYGKVNSIFLGENNYEYEVGNIFYLSHTGATMKYEEVTQLEDKPYESNDFAIQDMPRLKGQVPSEDDSSFVPLEQGDFDFLAKQFQEIESGLYKFTRGY